jgi:hypothetical protein
MMRSKRDSALIKSGTLVARLLRQCQPFLDDAVNRGLADCDHEVKHVMELQERVRLALDERRQVSKMPVIEDPVFCPHCYCAFLV